MKIRNKLGQFTSYGTTAHKNHKWKGNDVGYFGLHTWVQRKLGKAKTCSICGSTKQIQWANVSKKYRRVVEDWKQLCCVCHRRFDGITKLSKRDAEDIRNRYEQGHKQVDLAKRFGVDQGTISNIVNHKIQYYG